ncbi:MAG TPA: hypothetical protein VFG87_23800 [Amycolatopsis sp.]|nr:hypothetical protein [Amycolatopsis sp.]
MTGLPGTITERTLVSRPSWDSSMATAPGWIGASPGLPTTTCGQALVVAARKARSFDVNGADRASRTAKPAGTGSATRPATARL